jgi:hypothetical protein
MKNFQLSTTQRINHILFGSVLIVFTMLSNATPLGWLAVLPLLATYPIFAGLLGLDPLTRSVENLARRIMASTTSPTPRHTH